MRLEVNTIVRVLDFVGGEEGGQVHVIDFDFIGQQFKRLVEVCNVRILRRAVKLDSSPYQHQAPIRQNDWSRARCRDGEGIADVEYPTRRYASSWNG